MKLPCWRFKERANKRFEDIRLVGVREEGAEDEIGANDLLWTPLKEAVLPPAETHTNKFS